MKHKSEDYKISAVRFYLSNSSFTVDAINRQALHFQWSACLFIAISISLTSIPSGGKGYLYNTPRQRSPTCRGSLYKLIVLYLTLQQPKIINILFQFRGKE